MEAFKMMKTLGKNWQLKIICLLLAIVLWFVVIYQQNPTSEGSYTVPIVIENLDSKYIATNAPKTVYVRLSGPRNTIINIGASDIKAYIDLSKAEEGETTVPIHLELPTGTELKKQSMTAANLYIDVYAVQEFQITPHLVGSLEENISVENLKLVPEKVIVSGARRLINKIDQVAIDIPVDGKVKDFSLMAPIHLLQKDGNPVEGLEITPWQSNVKVTLTHNAVAKKVPVNLITYGALSPKVHMKQVVITPNEIEIRGNANAVKNIDRINLMPISVDGLEKNREWKVAIPPLDGVVMNPDTVQIRVEVEPDQ
jgi:YbbR domain-containing protein